MTDVMVYCRDHQPNAAANAKEPLHWHSNSAALGDLIAGDRLWVVTSGKSLNHEQERAGFLVAVWVVERVIENPGDDPAFPSRKYGYRIIGDETESIELDEPVNVDHVIRSDKFDDTVAVGRFLRGPRRLNDQRVRLMRAAAGPQMAQKWLTGTTSGIVTTAEEDKP